MLFGPARKFRDQEFLRHTHDVFMETWLPNFEVVYDKAIDGNEVIDVGLFFGDAAQGWFVPRYVIEGDSDRGIEPAAPGLASVQDLAASNA